MPRARSALTDSRVRVIQRIGRRGLSSACVEGMCATAAPNVAVIDGDMQHDEALLPRMLDLLEGDSTLDVVVGSRFVDGGGTGEWDRDRVAKSAFATKISRRVLKADLADPMSGFFMIRAAVVRELVPHLSAIGFKILLDLMTVSHRPLNFTELPYVFRTRALGESKLDHVVALEFLIALYDRMFGNIVPVRFAMFVAVGAVGAAVHFAVLYSLFRLAHVPFVSATVVATVAAMTFNFFLNNTLTYREQRLKGVRALFGGWVSFCLVLRGRRGGEHRHGGVPAQRRARRLARLGDGGPARRGGMEFRAVVEIHLGTVLTHPPVRPERSRGTGSVGVSLGARCLDFARHERFSGIRPAPETVRRSSSRSPSS